jgi:hypothetical protein
MPVVPSPVASAPLATGVYAPASRMKPRRIWLVYGLFAILVGGHLVEVVTQREHWPFSPYQMWSIPSRGWETNREMLRGVTDEPAPREVPVTPSQLYPIPYQMIVVNMQQAAKALKAGEPAKADAIIRGLLEQYEKRRAAKQHGGPPLKGLRLYQVTWKMDTDASEASKKNPTATVLLYPLLSDEQKAAAVPPVAQKIVTEFGDDNSE